MAVKTYDVLIVGSGHSGGMAANILTQKGISCLMLNAGPEADYENDRTIKHAYELPYRGFDKPGRLPHVFQANEFNANQWVDEKEVPIHMPVRCSLQLGARAAAGRPFAFLGAPVVPPEQLRIQSRRNRRHRR